MEQHVQNTALLIMDFQSALLASLPDTTQLISNVTRAIASARKRGIPVIYIVVGFRQGIPEMADDSKVKARYGHLDMAEFVKIHPDLTPLPQDIVVTKRRVSAFTGSDLEVILRARGIGHIVLAGIATSGVVLSTVREAADKDYQITVLADCCADGDNEVHAVLVNKIFARQGAVVKVEEWV